MLPCVEHWTTSREEFFEFSLVEMNDQVFEGNRLRILTLALDIVSLLRQKTEFPRGVAILFSINFAKGKTYKKKCRGAKL